jgi:hypothetical protein
VRDRSPEVECADFVVADLEPLKVIAEIIDAGAVQFAPNLSRQPTAGRSIAPAEARAKHRRCGCRRTQARTPITLALQTAYLCFPHKLSRLTNNLFKMPANFEGCG